MKKQERTRLKKKKNVISFCLCSIRPSFSYTEYRLSSTISLDVEEEKRKVRGTELWQRKPPRYIVRLNNVAALFLSLSLFPSSLFPFLSFSIYVSAHLTPAAAVY